MSRGTRAMPQGGRYLAVVIVGFLIDLGLVLTLNRLVGLPLTLSAAIGFGLALSLNYLLFEVWVFRGRERALSAGRFGATVGSALIALSVRLVVVEGLSRMIDTENALRAAAVVLAAAMASVVVNYVLVSKVFRRSDTATRP